MATGCCLVYITTPDYDESMRLCQILVEERLAAGANILDNASSIYWWQGQIESARECICLLKTSTERLDALIARTKELHSYTTPCIVALPLVAGHEDFLTWVRAESTPQKI